MNYVFNHFSIAKPHQLSDSDTKLAFGIGYRALIDLGMSREIKSKNDWVKSSEESTSNGGLYVITPTIAINLQDKYFLGVTLNKSVFGSIIHEINFTMDDSSDIKSEMEIEHF